MSKIRINLRAVTVILVVITMVTCAAYRNDEGGKPLAQPADSTLFTVPANFPAPVYRSAENPVTDAGFKLGKLLFYDPVLSKDQSISCANCHQQFAAFANLDHPVSHGVDDCEGTRNTPALFNLAWQKAFMWDGGVNHIELSPLNAMTSSCEMANSLDTITTRLKNTARYPGLFTAAFGSKDINSQRLFRALAQFTSMLISANSKYDRVSRKEPGATFTPEEKQGYLLFSEKCASCHREPLFTDGSYRSNGLDKNPEDIGRDSITGMATDRGKFRVPSLRNVEVTAPYMHDGRFTTLKQVLDHYRSRVQDTPNLDPEFRGNGQLGIALTVTEQARILDFLKTLTDHEFIHNKKFQPFN